MLATRSLAVASLALALVAGPVFAQDVAWSDPWTVTVAGEPDASADPWTSFDPSPSPVPSPSADPSALPSAVPSAVPDPSPEPSSAPEPSDVPPTERPTAGPTEAPAPEPTARPTPTPGPTLEVAFPLPTTPPVAPVDAPPRPDVVLIVLDDLPAMDARVWSRLPSMRALFLERGLVGSIAAAGGRSAVLTGRETTAEATPSAGPSTTATPRAKTAKAKAKAAKAKAAKAKPTPRPRATASPAPKGRKGTKRHRPTASPAPEAARPRVAETLASALARAGYATAFAGESPRRDGASLAGFDHTLVLGPGYLDVSVTRDGVDAGTAATSTGELGRGATALIASAPDDQPLFLAVAPFAPHVRTGGRGRPLPWAPDDLLADPRCGGIADWPLGATDPVVLAGPEVPLAPLCASLLPVDTLLTRLAVALAEAGRTDVLFILTSDDGIAAGVYGVPPKGTDGASRLPFLLAWPSALGGEPITTPIEAAQPDIAATVCDLAGCRFPKRLAPFPGRSFARALLDER